MTALHIVGEQGLDALTRETVAAESHLSAESVAAHYPELTSCLYEGYEEEASDLVRAVVAAYEGGGDWLSGFKHSQAQLLEWLSDHPAGARLFFVEAMRGDRELRLRRDLTRREIVDFLTAEYARSAN
ncbi:MAG: hypothetical protein JO321_06190, partial [Solirubrobacterales bacterium]|nr:hypothetical protein [Solirubrobacterales bacterium]